MSDTQRTDALIEKWMRSPTPIPPEFIALCYELERESCSKQRTIAMLGENWTRTERLLAIALKENNAITDREATARSEREACEQLERIASWRHVADEYDRDVDNPPRTYCEDIELIEQAAQEPLDSSRARNDQPSAKVASPAASRPTERAMYNLHIISDNNEVEMMHRFGITQEELQSNVRSLFLWMYDKGITELHIERSDVKDTRPLLTFDGPNRINSPAAQRKGENDEH